MTGKIIYPFGIRIRRRELAWAFAVLSLALFAAFGGDRPEDYVLPINAARPDVLGTLRAPASAAPFSNRCLRIKNGRFFRGAIRQCPDGDARNRWCWHECFYDERNYL